MILHLFTDKTMAQGQQPYEDDLCKQMEKVKIQPMD